MSLQRNYDIFEISADGCSIWRACVSGQFDAQRRIQELAEHSRNEFFAIDLRSHERLQFNLNPKNSYEQIVSRNKRVA
jgi:hypothetical protein